MKNIKIYFQNLKKNMPRHTQWILLGIALVTTIMLILLLSDDAPKAGGAGKDKKELSLKLSPASFDFGTVGIGEEKTLTVKILPTMPAIISEVSPKEERDDIKLSTTCANMGEVTEKIPCDITLTYKPATPMLDGKNGVNVKYYDAAGSKDMEKLETISVVFAAKEKENAPAEVAAATTEPTPEPIETEEIPEIIAEEPAPKPLSEPEPEPVAAKEDTADPFMEDFADEIVEPEPAPEPKSEPVALPDPKADNYVAGPEACYQFAFAGYNNGGKQIGWIKPSGGHYMFHPFEDKDCSAPTGEYNPKTGFITSLDDPSKKLGSDADRIGGRGAGANLVMPTLASPAPTKQINRALQLTDVTASSAAGVSGPVFEELKPTSLQLPSSVGQQAVFSSAPYDRTFVLRHFKPIPATIVNEIRATEDAGIMPVQATVDRHVYSDNGRTVVVPAGTLMLGNVDGPLPGPYKTIGRIKIKWYRFIRPDGVEFNFINEDDKPVSGDSQGRIGVAGYGSSDYLEQMVMPLLTAIVPAATNLIAPISDRVVNQIDLDNNVVVQSGNMRSSELAKQQMIESWNKVTEKLFVDMLDNTKPPFSIAAGTRITVYSPNDLIVAWCKNDTDCYPVGATPNNISKDYAKATATDYTGQIGLNMPESTLGQVASWLTGDATEIKDQRLKNLMEGFRKYQSRSMAASDAYYDQVKNAGGIIKQDGSGVIQPKTAEYNKEVLGMNYMTDADGNETEYLMNPNAPIPEAPVDEGLLCPDTGTPPDASGCCPGELFDTTVTSESAPNGSCCPEAGGDCFDPMF